MRRPWTRVLALAAAALAVAVVSARPDSAGDVARALANRLTDALDFKDDTPPPSERRIVVDAAEAMKTTMLDAVTVDPKQVRVQRRQGQYALVDRGTHIVLGFGDNERVARLVWLVFRTYGIQRLCFVGRPHASFTFLLAGGETRLSPPELFYKITIPGRAPTGSYPEIDSSYRNHRTIRFVNDRLELREYTQEARDKYRIMSGNTVLYAFDDRSEAIASMVFITLYEFNRKHTVYAAPGSSEEMFAYLTREAPRLRVRE